VATLQQGLAVAGAALKGGVNIVETGTPLLKNEGVSNVVPAFRVRAKGNAPSVLFFDEMDGLFPAPSIATGQHDVQLVEQGLIEISQLRPEQNVFLIGTSNYLERIDPRILRGGRFSEKLHIGLPDDAGYQKLIARYLGSARLDANLEIDAVIDRVRGLTPADLEATIQGMKRLAMRRMTSQHAALPPLSLEDLGHALSRVRPPV